MAASNNVIFVYHPIGNTEPYSDNNNVDDEHQFWIQIGSKIIPEYPIKSVQETFYQLCNVVGQAAPIYSKWYRTRRYILGIDTKKISGAGFTGISTKARDLLIVSFRGCGKLTAIPSRVYVALNYDCVLNLTSTIQV